MHRFVNVKCKLDFTLVHLQEINTAEGSTQITVIIPVRPSIIGLS